MAAISGDQLAPIVAAAKQLWTDALGVGDPRLAVFDEVTVSIANLTDGTLGDTTGTSILIDATAAGWGWFVDATPFTNSEFRITLGNGVYRADPASPAYGHMDLLTTVLHELGNAMGFAENTGQDVAGMTLAADIRRLPTGMAGDQPAPQSATSQARVPLADSLNLSGFVGGDAAYIPPSALGPPATNGATSTKVFHEKSGTLVELRDDTQWSWLIDGLEAGATAGNGSGQGWIIRGIDDTETAAGGAGPGLSPGLSDGVVPFATANKQHGDSDAGGGEADGPSINWNENLAGVSSRLRGQLDLSIAAE